MSENRYCPQEEIWVCSICGRHVERDRFLFEDESCMLNAISVLKNRCVYDKNNRVKEILEEEKDGKD